MKQGVLRWGPPAAAPELMLADGAQVSDGEFLQVPLMFANEKPLLSRKAGCPPMCGLVLQGPACSPHPPPCTDHYSHD